jgi:DNA-binding PadR family transcriptional regulator
MPRGRPSPLGLAVLGLLAGGPLHPYRMQRLLKEWGKDQVVNVGHRANLYAAIKRLHAAGAVRVLQVERDEPYPERTVYAITDHGRDLLLDSVAEMVSTPRNEFPEFPAALSFLMLFGPDHAARLLEERAAALTGRLGEFDAELRASSDGLPRVTLIETEYQRAMVAAELGWVLAVIEELASGGLSWSEADFAAAAAAYLDDAD